MRALVTNDDGISADGLRTLAGVALEAGLDVLVAAPHKEFSGSSASITALEADGRLVVHQRSVPGVDVRALGVEAAPAFIALTAAKGAFGPPPDLVLSGVNHGPNTGHAVLHSGTVGAALTAASHGRPALAVSMATGDPSCWDTAAEVARQALAWLLHVHGERPITLNVNVPDVPLDELRGLRRAPLATFGAVQTHVDEIGEGYVKLAFAEIDPEQEPRSDAALLLEGWATVTPLAAPCEADGVDLSDLAKGGG